MTSSTRESLRHGRERVRDAINRVPWRELTTAVHRARGRHAVAPGETPVSHIDERIAQRRAEVEATEWRRRRSAMVSSLLGVMLAAVLVAAVLATPLFAVRTVEVVGVDDAAGLRAEDILRFADVREGSNLLLIDVGAVAAGVGTMPLVAGVEVRRKLPSTVEIAVTPRVAIAAAVVPGGVALVDAEGTVLDVRPDANGLALPTVRTDSATQLRPGDRWDDVLARHTIAALAQLPKDRLPLVKEAFFERGQLVLTFEGGLRGVLGLAEDIDRKGRVLAEIFADLAARGEAVEYVDVSSPVAPTVKPLR